MVSGVVVGGEELVGLVLEQFLRTAVGMALEEPRCILAVVEVVVGGEERVGLVLEQFLRTAVGMASE